MCLAHTKHSINFVIILAVITIPYTISLKLFYKKKPCTEFVLNIL